MDMPIRLIAMDMDGTLLEEDHITVSPRNIAAIRAAHDRGVKIALASGRSWSLLTGVAGQLRCVDYALTANGASVMDVATGERFFSRPMPNVQALVIAGLLQDRGIPFEIYCGGKNYALAADRALIHRYNLPIYADYFETVTTFVDDLAQGLAGRDVEKFNCFYVPPEIREETVAAIRCTGPVEVANAYGLNLEFAAGAVSKGEGLKALCARLGLEAGEIMAFGDAGNDLEMLSFAGWSFAMENGSGEAKAHAKYLAPANTDDGVGKVIEKYLLEL